MTTPQRPVKPLPEESAALIISLSRHVNDESLQKLFNEIDTDNNGVIDTEELTTLLKRIYLIPTYGGSDISVHAREMAEALIAAADQNNDGKLQFGEFRSAIEIVSQGQSS